MNANEILDMIGDAKGTYLWETQKYRDGTAGAKPLPLPRRRLWLVAAVIGLMLLHGWSLSAAKTLLICVFLWLTSPVCSHLVAEMEVSTVPDLEKECEVEVR